MIPIWLATFGAKALGFLKAVIAIPLWLLVLGVAFLLVQIPVANHGGYKRGVAKERAAWEAKVAAAKKDVGKREAKAGTITTTIAAAHDKAQTEIVTRYRTLRQKVPVYVSRQADSRCVVPAGFVRLYNEAVAPGAAEVPRPAGGSDDAASDVALSTVLGFTTENFGIAYSWRQEALTWRDWYLRQKAEWDRP